MTPTGSPSLPSLVKDIETVRQEVYLSDRDALAALARIERVVRAAWDLTYNTSLAFPGIDDPDPYLVRVARSQRSLHDALSALGGDSG